MFVYKLSGCGFESSFSHIKEHNLNWPQIPDHSYVIFIVGGSGSGKTNTLLNLINDKPDFDKIYLYAKGPLKQNISC